MSALTTEWVKGIDYPEWATEESLHTLKNGYLQEGETPRQAWGRCAKAAASYYKDVSLSSKLEHIFFRLMWDNKLCLASPVLANMGTDRGLPISCNTIHIKDSVDSIFDKNKEFAILTKNGAGVGIYMGDIRGRGAPIKGNGMSEGIVPWCKVFDTTTATISQGSTRRGASAIYLPVNHPDIQEFINIRRPNQDENRRCLNINNAVCINDEFMHQVERKDKDARNTLKEIYKARLETGEPYLLFTDNVNRANPETYKAHNLKVVTSNLCNEIMLHTDAEHTFVCCLSSLNLARWNEITDEDIYYSIYFLDAVLEEYIQKASNVKGLEPAVLSAKKGRALGLGVLGWHTLLQSEMTAFDSLRASIYNRAIFNRIRKVADLATKELANLLGEPEWCKGFNRRNTHCLAVAPTVSNSIISGAVSQGIEPIAANLIAVKSAKGTFIKKNTRLVSVLEKYNKNTPDVWNDETLLKTGSVQHLPFLTEEEKSVFKTAFEIDQLAIVKQAAERQQFIDQGQSLNLFFTADVNPKYFHKVHWEAWKQGLKGLYYCRTSTIIKGDLASRSTSDDCKACEG
jgi:ribonucleoside-diphosphate reductase alpha chain